MVFLILTLVAFCHLLKYILLHPVLIRFCERIIDLGLTRVILQTYAVMRCKEVFHKDDQGFDFVKAKKGELFVNRWQYMSNSEPMLIIANDTSLLEFLWLQVTFSPVYVVMDFDDKTNKTGLRPVGRLELIKRACGITFPARVDGGLLYKSFKEVREAMYVQNRPLVFFPECTRSNGKGVLEPPTEAIELIIDATKSGKFAVHALRFDYSLNSASM